MAKIYKYLGKGQQFIEGVPARNILQSEWDELPENVRVRAEESGVYKKSSGAADPLDPESEPVEMNVPPNMVETEMEVEDEPTKQKRHRKS